MPTPARATWAAATTSKALEVCRNQNGRFPGYSTRAGGWPGTAHRRTDCPARPAEAHRAATGPGRASPARRTPSAHRCRRSHAERNAGRNGTVSSLKHQVDDQPLHHQRPTRRRPRPAAVLGRGSASGALAAAARRRRAAFEVLRPGCGKLPTTRNRSGAARSYRIRSETRRRGRWASPLRNQRPARAARPATVAAGRRRAGRASPASCPAWPWRRGVREELGVARLDEHRPRGGGDGALFMWFLQWTPYALEHGLNPLFTTTSTSPTGST